MKQFIIIRYQKGQEKYLINPDGVNRDGYISLIENLKGGAVHHFTISVYDLLFNPKWEFAKAFCKNLSSQGMNVLGIYTPWATIKQVERNFKSQMAIAPDVEKYLEQFKDAA